jgi:Methylamine utilisation protein MauE
VLIGSSGYLVIAAVFGVSGAIKLRHPGVFARLVENYRIVPRAAVVPVAVIVAVAEAGGAALLLLPAARLYGLLIAGGLIVMFLAAMSSAISRGTRIPCGCFGGPGELDVVGLPSMVRTGLLGVIVVASLAGRSAAFQPAQVLVASLLLALIFLLADMIRLLPRRHGGAPR